MSVGLKTVLFATTVFVAQLGAGLPGAMAQSTTVTPAPDPIVGAAPGAPSGASESYDEVAITQLMKVVELARLIGGGISQLYAEATSQKLALDLIRGAQVGPKTFPVHNGPVEVAQREGGTGLKEMAAGVLDGTLGGPTELVSATTAFRKTFKLDPILAMKDDKSLSRALLAQASAQAVVASSTADVTYKRANASMLRLNEYIVALQASADLKTSVDINTRVMVEVSQQLNEMLRTQAAMTSIAGAYVMGTAGEKGEADTFLDGLLDK